MSGRLGPRRSLCVAKTMFPTSRKMCGHFFSMGLTPSPPAGSSGEGGDLARAEGGSRLQKRERGREREREAEREGPETLAASSSGVSHPPVPPDLSLPDPLLCPSNPRLLASLSPAQELQSLSLFPSVPRPPWDLCINPFHR